MTEDCNYCSKKKPCHYHAKIEAGLIDEPKPFTDAELAQRASFDKMAEAIGQKRGWIDPRDKIIKDNMKTIKGVVLDYADGSDPDRWDDLFGASMFGAAKAVSNFDPDKGRIQDHIRLSCRNYVVMELRKINRWSTEVSSSVEGLSFDDWISNHKDAEQNPLWSIEQEDPEEELLHKEKVEYAQRRVQKIQSGLNERELYVLWHTILTDSPMTYRDIAEQFKCSKDSIFRDMNRIKKLLAEEVN